MVAAFFDSSFFVPSTSYATSEYYPSQTARHDKMTAALLDVSGDVNPEDVELTEQLAKLQEMHQKVKHFDLAKCTTRLTMSDP